MGARFSAPVQTGLVAHPPSRTMGTGSFPGVKSGQGVTLTPHPLLVPWSRKSTAIPLLPLCAVRLVQNLSVCTGVQFTFFLTHFNSVAKKIYSYAGEKIGGAFAPPPQITPMVKWSWCLVASSVISTGEFPNAITNRKLKRTNSHPSNIISI